MSGDQWIFFTDEEAYPIGVLSACSCVACLLLIRSVGKIHNPNISIRIIRRISVLIFFQCFCCIFTSLLREPDLVLLCRILGALASTFNTASMFYSTALAYYSYKTIKHQKKWNYMAFYNSLRWIILPTSLLLNGGYITMLQLWSENHHGFLTLTLAFYLPPSIFTFVIAVYCFLQQKSIIKNTFTNDQLSMMNVKLGKLSLYPLAQLFIFLPDTVGQLFKVYQPKLFMIMFLFYAADGIINSLVYLYIRNIHQGRNSMEENELSRSSVKGNNSDRLSNSISLAHVVGSSESTNSDEIDQKLDDHMLQAALRD